MPTRNVAVRFPLGGLDRSVAFQDHPPFATPDCNNVQPQDSLDERSRGGSRPGLQRTHAALPDAIRMLAEVTLARVEGDARQVDLRSFDGEELAGDWSPLFDGFPTVSPSLPFTLAAENAGVRGALLDDKSPRTDLPSVVEIFAAPYAGAYEGQTFGVVVAAEDSSTFEHFTITLDGDDYSVFRNGSEIASGTFNGELSGWFRVLFTGSNFWVSFAALELATGTDLSTSGTQVGFSLEAPDGTVTQSPAFRYDYHSQDPGSGFLNQLVSVSDGELYREEFPGIWSLAEMNSLSLNPDSRIRAADQLQKLWIADHGRVAGGVAGSVDGSVLSATESGDPVDFSTLGITSDMLVILTNGVGVEQGVYGIDSIATAGLTLSSAPGDGTTRWRVVRSPKIYDPIDNEVRVWEASAGVYPAGCSLVCRYRDRIVLAGDPVNPHLWYMSRQGDATDFNYGASDLDVQRAIAGQGSDAGVIGDAITALIPHSDDFLIVGCSSSMWVIRGDPAYGGQIDALSRTVGVVAPDAWAAAPDGSTWFVSPSGVFVVPPGAQGMPQPISRERLPKEFMVLGGTDVQCSWDHQSNGMRVFISDPNGGPGRHWLVKDGTFWPLSLPFDFEPTALISLPPRPLLDGPLLLGGRDGAVRRFDFSSITDDGELLASRVTFGPLRITGDEGKLGLLSTLRLALDERTGIVAVEVEVGNTAQEAKAFVNWFVDHTRVATYRPRARAHSVRVKLYSTGQWAFESMVLGISRKGVRRP